MRMRNIVCKVMLALAFASLTAAADAAEVVYKIVEYNKSTGDFTLTASGSVPRGSWAYFYNEYGATTGNRYNQIPRGREAALYLEGWQGCTVRSITFSMCSNNSKGQVGFSLNDGETPLYTFKPVDFASSDWFGSWVSKDLGVYVDVNKQLDVPALSSEEASIVVKGGTAEGSVYLDAITIEYDEPEGGGQESPLGWRYEKLEKKSTLADGDEVMIYRNGSAAADFDGMEQSHYLDVVQIASTADVTSTDVLRFTLGKTATGTWTLTDQYGRRLGATGKQSLAWDEGATEWTIDLGYDGAAVTSAGTSYGTLRYSTPENAYARFNVYTSTSLPLPYLYRKVEQKQPELSRSITFADAEMTVSLDAAHIGLRPTIVPSTTTDKRILWSSSDESVATVTGGFVTLLSVGTTTITARMRDSGVEATLRLVVTEPTGIGIVRIDGRPRVRKTLEGNRVVIHTADGTYTTNGVSR